MAMKAAIKSAIADGVLTFMWVFCASSLGPLTYVASSALGLPRGLPTLLITTIIVFLLLFIFGFIGYLLGGATFNPTAIAAFYAAGAGGADSLVSAALRFPAQAAGAVGGALAILEVMPMQYKHMLGGPSLKVDVQTGAIAEGVLTFIITFAVLLIVLRGPSNPLVKNWLLAMSTVTLVVAGSSYTGPSMNPANGGNHVAASIYFLIELLLKLLCHEIFSISVTCMLFDAFFPEVGYRGSKGGIRFLVPTIIKTKLAIISARKIEFCLMIR
ncbi:UNVERIFIED_CONTAM: Aquaporin SIP1-2 [Sesamum indicum]